MSCFPFITSRHEVVTRADERFAKSLSLSSTESSESSSDGLRVLSYNASLLPKVMDFRNLHRQERLERMMDEFECFDVVCLQGVYRCWTTMQQELIAGMQHRGFHYHSNCNKPSFVLSGRTMDGGLLILSRHPIVAEEKLVFTSAVGSDAWATKGALYAKIQRGKDLVHVCNTNLQRVLNFGELECHDVRRMQLLEMGTFVTNCVKRYDPGAFGRAYPIVICGDFNINGRAKGRSSELPVLYESMRNVESDFQDLLYLEHGEHPVTFNCFKDAKSPCESMLTDFANHDQNQALDYIFFYPTVNTTTADTRVERFLVDDVTPALTQLSDHFGVSTTLLFGSPVSVASTCGSTDGSETLDIQIVPAHET